MQVLETCRSVSNGLKWFSCQCVSASGACQFGIGFSLANHATMGAMYQDERNLLTTPRSWARPYLASIHSRHCRSKCSFFVIISASSGCKVTLITLPFSIAKSECFCTSSRRYKSSLRLSCCLEQCKRTEASQPFISFSSRRKGQVEAFKMSCS